MIRSHHSGPFAWGSDYIVNKVQFLAQTDCFASEDLNMSSGGTGINSTLPDMLFFFTLTVPLAIDLHFMNHQGPHFQLKNLFAVLLKKKNHDYLRVSKLKANFHFWVNYPYKQK